MISQNKTSECEAQVVTTTKMPEDKIDPGSTEDKKSLILNIFESDTKQS